MRLHVPVSLRWSDIDAYAHVNNASMVRLLEQVRIDAFWVTGDDAPDADGPAVLDGRPGATTVSLIAHQELDYLLPIPYQRAPLDAEVWVGRLGGASVLICYEVYTPIGVEPRALYTRAASTLVLADAATGRPRRITDAEREAWSPYLEDPVTFGRR